MKWSRSLLGVSAVVASGVAFASSHREAPALRNDPAVDITDLYAYPSPEDTANKVTLIMNVSPGYIPAAGPNWYSFDDDAVYEIHIDKTGDAVEDITYQFKFTTAGYGTDSNVLAYLPTTTFSNGRFSGSLSQTYTLKKITGLRRSGNVSTIKSGAPVAPVRIGPGTTDGGRSNIDNTTAMYSAYKTLADNAIISQGDYKMFAGPRADPFYVDLGGVFDSLYVRLKPLGVNSGTPVDSLSGINVLSIVLNVPQSETGKQFAVWATTSRPQGAVRRLSGKSTAQGGAYVQVSRLGNPLVNEVVIGLKDKDKFNATEPKDDVTNFASYVVKPQLAALLNALYGKTSGAIAKLLEPIVEDNRNDLVAAFVTGIDSVNKLPSATGAGDMLRVNLNLPADYQHWPASGRQPSDDVVKAALTFLANCSKLPTIVTSGAAIANPAGSDYAKHAESSVNCVLDDAVTAADKVKTPGGSGPYLTAFPYLDLPFSAYSKANL